MTGETDGDGEEDAGDDLGLVDTVAFGVSSGGSVVPIGDTIGDTCDAIGDTVGVTNPFWSIFGVTNPFLDWGLPPVCPTKRSDIWPEYSEG